ncbi:CRISPR-associated protein Cas5 [Idiomarina seosinensis]
MRAGIYLKISLDLFCFRQFSTYHTKPTYPVQIKTRYAKTSTL